jgi:hypothetical protein
LDLVREAGVIVNPWANGFEEMKNGHEVLEGAAGGSLLDLVALTGGLGIPTRTLSIEQWNVMK